MQLKIKASIKDLLGKKDHQALICFSIFLAVNSLLLILSKMTGIVWKLKVNVLYFSQLALFVATLYLAIRGNTTSWKIIFKKILWSLSLSQIIIFAGLILGALPSIIAPFVGFFWILVGLFYLSERKTAWPSSTKNQDKNSSWFAKQGRATLIIVFMVWLLYLTIGLYNIEKFAAVDEPLWTFGRIKKYWNNVGDMDNWKRTLVSDKPGVTVSITSGIGLLWENPTDYKPTKETGHFYKSSQNIEHLNWALRAPILILTALFLLILYFFLSKLLSKEAAVLSLAFISFAPLLMGISRIINPDSLLWIIGAIAIVTYLLYLEHRKQSYLYLTGIFLGLALLTKYVANILIIYFFTLIFLEYIINSNRYTSIPFRQYIKETLIDFFILLFFSLAVFYLFLPAAWINPSIILKATLLSQAFESTSPIFLFLLLAIGADYFFNESRFFHFLLQWLANKKKIIQLAVYFGFLASTGFIFLNVYSQMSFYDLEQVFISPKSSGLPDFPLFTIMSVFAANFYPLLFGIFPLAVFSLVFLAIWEIKRLFKGEKASSVVFFLWMFITLYYLGSAVNNVASIIRYQIMVFPIALILAAIGIYELTKILPRIKRYPMGLYLVAAVFSFYSLITSFPFYSSYASSLLPKEYYVNLKSMGDGSYEAAEFLNNLPESEKITIWTDKSGICYFFSGQCLTGFNTKEIAKSKVDYFVVSAGRERRTKKMSKKKDDIDFAKFYDSDESQIFRLNILDRPGHHIKIIENKE